MSLELSKEMLTVEGYLTDARLIVEKQLGKRLPEESWAKSMIEIARMLQIEHQHNLHKKPRPEKTQVRSSGGDRVMSEARAHPQVPPIVSASDDDDTPIQPKRKHTRKVPVEVKPTPRRVTPLSEGRAPRVRKPKAKTPAKPRRR